jgi:hypothetical protein
VRSDSKFKQSVIAWHHLCLGLRRWVRALRDDITWNVFPRPRGNSPPSHASMAVATAKKPLIFVSYATDADLRGSHKFCGGEKLLNNLVLLLRRHDYEAWMVSTDGKHSEWLCEHAPFLSIEEFRSRLAGSKDNRCVTSWIIADAFLQCCPRFFFWDQELGASSRSHFPRLAREMAHGRIIRTAGVNRTVQAWHRATFGQPALLLRQLVDEEYWQPDEQKRVPTRVGYFDEGAHGERFIAEIRERALAAGLELDFHLLQGIEKEIISQMQTCGVFLALNVGKSPLYGEGGPMTPQEAMACGTVPICFDISGPWELIQQNYNGVVLSEFTPASMAGALLQIYQTPGRLEQMRVRCLEISRASHSMEARWPDVCRFLDLDTGSYQQ